MLKYSITCKRIYTAFFHHHGQFTFTAQGCIYMCRATEYWYRVAKAAQAMAIIARGEKCALKL